MAKKKSLNYTLAQLQLMSLAMLSVVFNECTGNEVPADSTEKSLVDEILKVASPAPEEKPEKVTKEKPVTFKKDGQSYRVAIPKVEIPGIGIRTALEICADEESQEYLIKNGCVGSVLEKIGGE